MHQFVTEPERLPRPAFEVLWRPPADVAELLAERRAERDACASAIGTLTGREDVQEVVGLLTRHDALSRLVTALETPPPVMASASMLTVYGRARDVPPAPTERERLEGLRVFLTEQLSGEVEIPLTDLQRGALHGFPDYGGHVLRQYKEENRRGVETELREVESRLAALAEGDE